MEKKKLIPLIAIGLIVALIGSMGIGPEVDEDGRITFNTGDMALAFGTDTKIREIRIYDDTDTEVATFTADGGTTTITEGTTIDRVEVEVRIEDADVPSGETHESATRVTLEGTNAYTYGPTTVTSADSIFTNTGSKDLFYFFSDVNYTIGTGETVTFTAEYEALS